MSGNRVRSYAVGSSESTATRSGQSYDCPPPNYGLPGVQDDARAILLFCSAFYGKC
jgi:hypothetical protein